jgi:hypothetical protein
MFKNVIVSFSEPTEFSGENFNVLTGLYLRKLFSSNSIFIFSHVSLKEINYFQLKFIVFLFSCSYVYVYGPLSTKIGLAPVSI